MPFHIFRNTLYTDRLIPLGLLDADAAMRSRSAAQSRADDLRGRTDRAARSSFESVCRAADCNGF